MASNVTAQFTDLTLPQGMLYLISTYVIGYLVYALVFRKKYSEFAKDAFAKDIWFTKTTAVDFSFFLLFVAGISTGIVFGFDAIEPTLNYLQAAFLPDNVGKLGQFPDSTLFVIAWTLVLVVITDFLHFFIHWIEHKFRFFWCFHATHHSASRMNPFVGYRLHPVELFLVRFVRMGVAPAIFVVLTYYLFGAGATPYLFYGVPIYFFVYYLYSNLRHTEVWITFPRPLSYILCSPAMHQIHHSNNPKWFNTNMSFIFSLWDWLFGTIYIPTNEDRKNLQFGLPANANVPAGSFLANLINPFVNVYRWMVPK